MKLIAVTSLGLVAARPQNMGNGAMGLASGANALSGDLGALDGGLGGLDALGGLDDVPDISVNQSQLDDAVDAVVDAVESKKPMPDFVPSDVKHADAINDKIKEVYEKYEAAFDKKQQFKADTEAKIQAAKDKHQNQFEADTASKIQAAKDKHQDKVDRVIDNNNKFAAAHQEKKAFAQAHKQKLAEKHQDKVDKNDNKKQQAQDQKQAVEDKTAKKKFNAVEAQKKKDEAQAKKDAKAAHMKKAHYHKVITQCWKQLKEDNPDLGKILDEDLNDQTFASLPDCAANLQDFSDWDKVKDWFKPMNGKPMNGEKPMNGNGPMSKPEGENKN